MKLPIGISLLLAKAAITLRRWADFDATTAAGQRSTPRPVRRACTRLEVVYGEPHAERIVNALGRNLYERVTHNAHGMPPDAQDLARAICDAAKFSRYRSLTAEQVIILVLRRVEFTAALALKHEVTHA